MAKTLSLKAGVNNADLNFPYGKIVNNATPVDENVYQDFHQFFARLLAMSGIAANNLFDNDANGYQYYEALGTWQDAGTTLTATPDTGTVTIQTADVVFNKFRVLGKTLEWQVRIISATISGSPTEISIAFPTAITTLLGSAFIANNNGVQLGQYFNGTADSVLYVIMDVTTDSIKLSRSSTTSSVAFTAGTNNQVFNFHLTIPLN